jgi:hypothetical protein
MRTEYIIVAFIIFIVVLISMLSFGKDIVPSFNEFIGNLFNIAKNIN